MGFKDFNFMQDAPNSKKLIASITSDAYIDYLLTLSDYMKKGIITSDFLNTSKDAGNLETLYISGDSGVWRDDAKYTYNNEYAAKDKNPNWTALPIAFDKTDYHVNDVGNGGGVALTVVYISGSCENPELALQFLNFGYTDEGDEWDDGSGTLYFLRKYATSALNRDMLSHTDGGYTLNVPACGLYRYQSEYREDLELVELGSWEFSIPLTEKSVSPVVELGDVQIEVAEKNYAVWDGAVQRFEPGTYSLQDVIVTCSSVSYYYDEMFCKKDSASGVSSWLPDAVAILSDGTEIAGMTGGVWDFEESRYLMNSWWPLPMAVEEIVSTRIEETVIPVN